MKKEPKKIDQRFLMGLAVLVFLVLVNSFVKDIPWFIVAIPSLIMGVDMESIIKAVKGK
jgi:hypothetical protein